MLRSGFVKRLPRAVYTPKAHVHALSVPDYTVHSAVTPFKNGIPTELVRELKPWESKWDFWTSSDAFTPSESFPSFLGYKLIPHGQTWVLEDGKVLNSGWNFLIPAVNKIKAIKNSHTVISGVFSEELVSKNGKTVEAYAVVYFKVADFKKSAFYVDPESNKSDSERAVTSVVQKFLAKEVPSINATEDGTLSSADSASLAEKLLSKLKTKESEFGLEFSNVDVRGVFPVELQVPLKIRALEAPEREPDAIGHGLSNDYWADALTPPQFEKYKYGSRKEDKTPASVSLVWSIPSPPDFHHFNHIPRVCVNEESSVQKA